MSNTKNIDPQEMMEEIKNASFDEDIDITIDTTKGEINLTLYASKTPHTVANFIGLSKRGFYDNLLFHRVISDFMIQCGCPNGIGNGGPGYTFSDEFVPGLIHDSAGILSMANAGPNTNGSQFFITHVPTPWLDGKHTVFGKVKSSSDQNIVNKIEMGDQVFGITIHP